MSIDFLIMPLYSWIKLSTLAVVSNFVANLIQLELVPCYVYTAIVSIILSAMSFEMKSASNLFYLSKEMAVFFFQGRIISQGRG